MHKLTICLLMILGTVALAADGRASFKNGKARAAKAEYERAVERADAAYKAAVKQAKERYRTALESSLAEVTKAGDLDDALSIRDEIKSLKDERAKAPADDSEPDSRPDAPSAPGSDTDEAPSVRKAIPKEAVAWQRHHYLVVEAKENWADAAKKAADAGGHLARIESMAEQAFIERLLSERAKAENYWLDGTDAPREGSWVFSDGKPIPIRPWHTEEPDDMGGEDALAIARGLGWKWFDGNGQVALGYLIEWDY